MIIWLTGNSGAGKTTLANKMRSKNTIVLDGDELRGAISTDLGLSKEDRIEHNLRVAKLASVLDKQGFSVVVSVICPYRFLRLQIRDMIGCVFVHVVGGKEGEQYPYEVPLDDEIIARTSYGKKGL